MKLLSDDDLDLRGLGDEELAAAWDLWFDLAQTTNDRDPPFTHGVLVLLSARDLSAGDPASAGDLAPTPSRTSPATSTSSSSSSTRPRA